MKTKSTEGFLSKIEELECRLADSEQMIEAIRSGEVDAFAFNKNNKSEVFTLESGDYAYRILIENFNEGALNLSEDGLIVYTNNYFHDLLNLSYENVIGHSVFDFIHSASKESFNRFFKKGLTGQVKGEINLMAGKKMIPVYVSLTSLYPNLPTVGMIVTDLTEKKKQEQLLHKQNKELMHNKNFIANVLQSTSHGVLSYVAIRQNNEVVDFEVRYANDMAFEQLNLPAERVIGSKYLTLVPQAKKQGLWDRLMRVLNTRKSEVHELASPVFPDRWFQVKYTPLDDGVTCTFIEITEQKRDAEILEEKNIELAKMNKELETFTFVSSHDLQEPLRKIKNFANVLLKEEQENLSDTGKGYLQRMEETVKRMHTLIEDLLSYSRLKSTESKIERTDLNRICQEVITDFEGTIKEKNAIISVSGLCEMNIIPFQFRQLMQNLIGNALKFCYPGRSPYIIIRGRIEAGNKLNNNNLLPDANYCHIGFTDNGIGFDPKYKDRIFEVFQRLYEYEEYKGTGIGLAICKKIIENHNGFITATGELNKGARFDIYLPVL